MIGKLTDRTNRYYFNTFCQAALQGVSFIVSLVVTSILVKRLGTERFGLWGTLSAAFGFIILLDMGVGSSFMYYFAKPLAAKDFEGLRREMAAGLWSYILIVALLIPTALASRYRFLSFIQVPGSLWTEASRAYFYFLAAFSLRWLLIVNRSLLYAAERVDILSIMGIISTLVQGGLNILVALRGGNVLSLAKVNFLTVLVASGGEMALAQWYVMPWGLSNFRIPSWAVFSRQFHYGVKLWIVGLTETVQSYMNKILLAHWVTLPAVASYDIGNKAAMIAMMLPSVLLPAIGPAVAQWAAEGKTHEVARFYRRLMAGTLLFTIPIAAFFILRARWILSLWLRLNSPDPQMISAVAWLTLAQAAFAITGPGRLVARGVGEPGYEMRSSVLTLVFLALLSVPGVYYWGLRGALVGTTVSLAFGSIYFLVTFHRHCKIHLLREE